MTDSAGIIISAYKNKLAVPAFNIPYLPMVEPVINAVRDQDAFAFIAVARLEWIKFEAVSAAAVYDEFMRHYDPAHVRLHLDHVPVIDEDGVRVDYMHVLREAVGLGYHSVMLDGSRLSFEENVECTCRAVETAHAGGAACEAELGAVMGHEDGPEVDYESIYSSGKGFTDVDEAASFVEHTGCDWLSVAIGNIHGAIAKARKGRKKIAAKLDLDHLSELARATGIPLVLHGGSSVPVGYVREAVKLGISKINIATEIRQAYEERMADAGSCPEACRAVYERTVWILRDYLGVAGTARKLTGEG